MSTMMGLAEIPMVESMSVTVLNAPPAMVERWPLMLFV